MTANDAGDPDTGANDLQNFPALTSAASDGSSTTVEGTLNSAPSTTYRLEFFSSPVCDASGNGEGRVFLGSADVTTDANGDVSFSVPLSSGVTAGDAVVGTATDPAGSTSEFSACVEATAGGVSRFNWHYEYDPLYRLTYACSDWDEVAAACVQDAEFFRYTYDGVGNRLTQVTLSGTNNYTYDSANRLTGVDGVSYSWDAKGNLLSDGTWSYAYNHANRLVSADDGVDSYDFAYNGLGDRLQQMVNGTPTDYTLDIVSNLTQVLHDGSNAYLYGAQRIGEEQSGGWQYHLVDALRSVRQLTDAAAAVTATSAYEPFGSTLAYSGTASSSHTFTGERLDGTGLLHLRARYYNPYLNQWIQPDPIVPDPHIPADWNRYAYVRNNPINYTDPSGMVPCGRAYQYCRLDDPKYAGLSIDVTHLFSSWDIADQILRNLVRYRGETGTFSVKEQGGYMIPRLNRRMYQIEGQYWIDLSDMPGDHVLRRIGLGIFMDFQIGYEFYQPCLPFGHCSSFANEDLPSDYLGYIARAKNISLDNALDFVLEELGGGHAEERDPIYTGTYIQGILCKLGICDEEGPYNRCFTFKRYDELTRTFGFVNWPSNLQLTGGAIGPGQKWNRLEPFSFSLLPLPPQEQN